MLIKLWSPVFTKVVYVKKGNLEKVGLRTMGMFETLTSAIGIKFPESVSGENSNVYYNLKDLKENTGFLHYKGRRPIVVHPECTKTNGLGVLTIDSGLVKIINEASE